MAAAWPDREALQGERKIPTNRLQTQQPPGGTAVTNLDDIPGGGISFSREACSASRGPPDPGRRLRSGRAEDRGPEAPRACQRASRGHRTHARPEPALRRDPDADLR